MEGKENIQLVIRDIKIIKAPGSAQIELEEKSNSPLWVDHRKKTNIESFFANYIKTSKNNVGIFAENHEILKTLQNDQVFSSKIVNRLNIFGLDELVLFDLPADLAVLSELLDKSNPRLVHLAGNSYNRNDPAQLIKTLSGMLNMHIQTEEWDCVI